MARPPAPPSPRWAGVKLTQFEKMKRFLDYGRSIASGDDVADSLGRVMEAGSEATAEKPGKHSAEAATFALDAILAAGSFGSCRTPPGTPLASIAKSYIHELASGARFDKAVYRTSGMTRPGEWLPIPGVTPAFYLSPGDTYRFLQTFAGEERLTDDFDKTAAPQAPRIAAQDPPPFACRSGSNGSMVCQ